MSDSDSEGSESAAFDVARVRRRGGTELHVLLAQRATASEVLALLADQPLLAQVPDDYDTLPLYTACRTRAAGRVIKQLVALYPEAAGTTGEDELPLHAALEAHKSAGDAEWLSGMLALVAASPAAAAAPDEFGRLPLHMAAALDDVPAALISALIEAYPAGASTPSGFDESTPLHSLVRRQRIDADAFAALLTAAPEAAAMADDDGDYPLHTAAKAGAPLAIVTALIAANPEAASKPGEGGCLPLHFALQRQPAMRPAGVVDALQAACPAALMEASDAAGEVGVRSGGELPLHAALRALRACSASQVAAETDNLLRLLHANPAAAGERTQDGWFPLSIAALARAPMRLVAALYDAFPSAIRERGSMAVGLPLHLALAPSAGAIDVPVAMYLLERHPLAVNVPDTLAASYFLPLHLACATAGGRGTDDAQEASLIRALIALNPAAAAQRGGPEGRTPLHWLASSHARPASLAALLETFPGAAAIADAQGKLPLHLLVASPLVEPSVVKMLTSAHPEAVSTCDGQGALPLHRCAGASNSEWTSSEATLAMTAWLAEDDKLLEQQTQTGRTSVGTASGGAAAGTAADEASAAQAAASRAPLAVEELRKQRDACYARHIGTLRMVQVLDALIDIDPSSIRAVGAGSEFDSTAPTGLTALHLALCHLGPHAVMAVHLLRRWPAAALMRAPNGDLPVHGLVRWWKHLFQPHEVVRAQQKESLVLSAFLRETVAALSLFLPAHGPASQTVDAHSAMRLHGKLEPLTSQDVHRFLTPHWAAIVAPRLLQAVQLWAGTSSLRIDASPAASIAAAVSPHSPAGTSTGESAGSTGAGAGSTQEHMDSSAAQDIPWFAALCGTTEKLHQSLAAACIDALPSVGHVRAVASIKDDGGRTAFDASPAPLRAAFQRRLLLFGCFEVDAGAPAHISETCIVRLATVKAPLHAPVVSTAAEPEQAAAPAALAAPAPSPPVLMSSRSSDVPAAASDYAAGLASASPPQQPLPAFKVGDRVALKFMRHKAHYNRERSVRARVPLDARYVMPLLACFRDTGLEASTRDGSVAGAAVSPGTSAHGDLPAAPAGAAAAAHASGAPAAMELLPAGFSEEAAAHGIPRGYGFCLALPAASRSLSDIMTHELIAGRDWPRLRELTTQLGEALQHIHAAGLVHGDVKPLNIMLHGSTGRFLLIDLDGAAPIGGPAGDKHSAAYLAPERLAVVNSLPYRYACTSADEGTAVAASAVAAAALPSGGVADAASCVGAGDASAAAASLPTASGGTAPSRSVQELVPQVGPRIDAHVRSLRSGLVAHPAQDMWSLGIVLFEAFAGRPLLAAGADGSADEAALRSIAGWSVDGDHHDADGAHEGNASGLVLHQQLQAISDPLARNLVAWLLHPRPEHRPSAERLLAHTFVSGHAFARMPGQPARWDVFLSYRVATDASHVQGLYERLTAAGLRVFWDKVCLLDGQKWEQSFVEGLASTTLLVPVLSPKGVENFLTLAPDSRCDNVLLEHRLGLELRALNWVSGIYPVLLNATELLSPAAGADADGAALGGAGAVAQTAAAPAGFVGQWFPPTWSMPTCTVHAVEAKVRQHLASLCLGSPLLPELATTVRGTMASLMEFQAFLLDRAPAQASAGAAGDAGSPPALQPVAAALDAAAAGIIRALHDALGDDDSAPLSDAPPAHKPATQDAALRSSPATETAHRLPAAAPAAGTVAATLSRSSCETDAFDNGVVGALVQLARHASTRAGDRTPSGGAGSETTDSELMVSASRSPSHAGRSSRGLFDSAMMKSGVAIPPPFVPRALSASSSAGSATSGSGGATTQLQLDPEQLAARLANLLSEEEVLSLQRLVDAAATGALHIKRAASASTSHPERPATGTGADMNDY